MVEIDWPSWIQALGSVAGIAAAIWIASADSRDRRIERLRNARREGEEDERRERERFETEARFMNFVREEIDSADDALGAIAKSGVSLRDDPCINPDFDPSEFIAGMERKLEDRVHLPLRRIAALPVSFWPNPRMAAQFFDDFRLLEHDVEALHEHFAVKLVPSAQAQWVRHHAIVDRIEAMAKLAEHRFFVLRRLAAAYLVAAAHQGYESEYPFWQQVRSKIAEEERARLQDRDRPWLEGHTREELEEMYDEISAQEEPYRPE